MARETRPEVTQPRLGVVGYLRWAWRQLTSMRTALFLLLLLAVGAVPGSVCLLYTSPSPRDRTRSRMPSSA